MPRARQHAVHTLLGVVASSVFGLACIGPASAATTSPVNSGSLASTSLRTADPLPTETTPLSVEISTLSPAVMPASGRVTVTGTVTNADEVAWLDVGIYPFVSATPITTEAALDEAAELPASAEVGRRILASGDYITVDRIDPGESVDFRLSIPRRDLSAVGVKAQGVYWFGVHALGSGPNGADSVADGRARTFLPLLAADATKVDSSVIVPIRAAVKYDADGRVAELERWRRLLAPGGRLAKLAELARTPDASSISWLVDPAVVDAVAHLADGNLDRMTLLEAPDKGTEEPSASPSANPSAAPETPTTPAPTTPSANTGSATESSAGLSRSFKRSMATSAPTKVTTADQPTSADSLVALATQWTKTMAETFARGNVLALPYGDLDLSGAALFDRDTYAQARAASYAAFEALGLSAVHVNAPLGGVLDAITADYLAEVDPAALVLVRNSVVPETVTTTRADSAGLRLISYDDQTSAGGPGPTNPLAAVAVRQRTLADAALRSLNDNPAPLLVTVPSLWSAPDTSQLAAGLNQPWLTQSPLNVISGNAESTEVLTEDLNLNEEPPENVVNKIAFEAAESLTVTGNVLDQITNSDGVMENAVTAQALASVSAQRRGHKSVSTVDARLDIDEVLSKITVQAPRSVTLSGASGRFASTVTNGLKVPVTVVLASKADAGISISTSEMIEVSPGSTSTVLLEASDARVGVHSVMLTVTSVDGMEFGESVEVPIRAAQVSNIIWVFMGVGVGLLFLAIALRLIRRVKNGRSTEADETSTDETAPEGGADE